MTGSDVYGNCQPFFLLQEVQPSWIMDAQTQISRPKLRANADFADILAITKIKIPRIEDCWAAAPSQTGVFLSQRLDLSAYRLSQRQEAVLVVLFCERSWLVWETVPQISWWCSWMQMLIVKAVIARESLMESRLSPIILFQPTRRVRTNCMPEFRLEYVLTR